MAGTLTVDTIQSDSSYASTLNVASKINFTSGMQIGGQDTTFGGMRNRIINGDMRINQRADASNTANNGAVFCLDRWQIEDSTDGVFTGNQSSDVPTGTGFKNSLKLTVTTADTSIASNQYATFTQHIEGYNWADMNWGSSSASTVTLSFWAKSSVVGTYTSFISNNGANRWYVQGFTINSANTWEYKTVVIPGDTLGTWSTTYERGASFQFHLAHGGTQGSGWSAGTTPVATGQVSNWMATVGNTFFITGVQIEKGSAASPFEYRHYGTELALCQRYYQVAGDANNRIPAFCGNSTNVFSQNLLVCPMRAQPSLTLTGAMDFDEYYVSGRTQSSSSVSRNSGGTNFVIATFGNFTGLTRGNPGGFYSATYVLQISAEL